MVAKKKIDIRVLYSEFLYNYISKGGTPSEIIDEDFPIADSNWRAAEDDEVIKQKFASKAENIIVPKDTTITFENIGANNLYFLADYTMKSKTGYIPKFRDT